jgi:hypothetical protein
MGFVPQCYATAIQRATLLSLGGIIVDHNFELRACAAGFKNVIEATINTLGCETTLQNFLSDKATTTITAKMLHGFLSNDDTGKQIRRDVLLGVASAVHNVGCEEYAETMRSKAFSI